MTTRELDLSMPLARMGGDAQLLRELAVLFLEDGPRRLAELQASLDAGQLESASRAAHSLYGLASNFDAAECVAAATSVEVHADAADISAARASFGALSTAVGRLSAALHDVLDTRNTAPLPP